MANSETFARATDSFIRGFSFVDEMQTRKRNSVLLQERLREEREERKHARSLADARETRAQAAHDAQEEDRESRNTAIEREKEARRAIAEGRDPIDFADTDTGFAELQRQGREDEAVAAATELNRMFSGAGQLRAGAGLSQQAGEGLPQLENPANAQDVTQQPIEGESLLAPTSGFDSLQRAPIEDLEDSLPPASGLAERVGRFAGIGKAVVPEDFTTADEFANITDPREIEETRRRNQEITDSLLERVEDPEANNLKKLGTAGQELTAEAAAAERVVTERYGQVLDEQADSAFRELLTEEPAAALGQYFEDRATLNSADPLLKNAMDRAVQPAILDYERQLWNDVADSEFGSVEQRRHVKRLRNLQATASKIYNDYRPAQAADINARGLPVGNQELAGRMVNEIESDDRPRPASPPNATQVNTALTTVNRIKPNTRLNETQIRAIVRAKDYGFLTPGDTQTILLTGSLPPSSLGVKLTSHDPAKELWATDANGNSMLVRPAKKKPGTGSGGHDFEPNELSNRAIGDLRIGLKSVFPDATEAHEGAVVDLVLANWDKISNRTDFRSQQSTIELGRLLGQTIFMNAAENHRRANNWIPFDDMFDAPSPQEIFNSPDIQDKYAARFDIMLQGLPEVRAEGIPQGFDVDQARSFLINGGRGQEGAEIGESGSPEEVYEYILRLNAIEDTFGTPSIYKDQ